MVHLNEIFILGLSRSVILQASLVRETISIISVNLVKESWNDVSE